MPDMPNKQNTNQPILEVGQIIPAFTLPGADGMPYSPWTYKQREHLLLLFTRSTASGETRGLLRAFAGEYKAFREETCAILAISPDTVIAHVEVQEMLHLPFPLLADAKGEVISRYTRWNLSSKEVTPSFVLADRYGALYQQWMAEHEADLPPIADILASLDYMNKLCTP